MCGTAGLDNRLSIQERSGESEYRKNEMESKKLLKLLFWFSLTTVSTASLGQGLPCDIRVDTQQTYSVPSDSGIVICLMCPPGTHRIPNKNCSSANSIDHCRCCPSGTFQPDYTSTATSCMDCQFCRKSEILVRHCNGTHDTKCLCQNGYFCEKIADACITHSPCPAGWGVDILGNEHHDTICKECLHNNTFSNVSSKTKPCNKCSVCDYGTTQRCTPKSDTVCSSKPGNVDVPVWVWPTVAFSVITGLCLVVVSVCYYRRSRPDANSLLKKDVSDSSGGNTNITVDGVGAHPGKEEIFRVLFRSTISSLSLRMWKNVIRDLKWGNINVDNTIIDRAEVEHPKNLLEQIQYCLNEYRRTFPDKTPADFVRDVDPVYVELKEKLTDKLRELANESSTDD